jgi:uncharacterized protein YxeA
MRKILIALVILLVAVPGAAVVAKKLVRSIWNQVVASQRQIDEQQH